MQNGKVSKIDILTIIIAFTALIASFSSIYFQFFNNTTELSAKFAGTTVDNLNDTYQSEVSLLFLNTGNTEVALISGFVYLSVDKTIPQNYFSGSRKNLNEKKKKWLTQSIDIESSMLINSGKIISKKFKLKLAKEELLEFLEQNFDLKSKQEVEFHTGISLNLIDSKGKLKMINITPSIVTLKYNIIDESIKFHGSGSNVNRSEINQVVNTYKIF